MLLWVLRFPRVNSLSAWRPQRRTGAGTHRSSIPRCNTSTGPQTPAVGQERAASDEQTFSFGPAVTEAFFSSCWQGLWPFQCELGDKKIWKFWAILEVKGPLKASFVPGSSHDSTRLSTHSFTLSAGLVCVCHSAVRLERAFSPAARAPNGFVRKNSLHSL